MIPKVIHYCWFGGKSKSKLIRKCIKSWKKYCPDFEIKEWNESNFNFSQSVYATQAYKEKKWAFVSDYARFVVLKKYGGIYLDTDVELLKPLDDELLSFDFVGFEDEKNVACGLIMGSHQDSYICDAMLKSYQNDVFLKNDGKLNLITVCQRMTELLKAKGLILNNTCQQIDSLKIYDSRYFNPKGIDGKGKITEVAYSVHHYNASWYTPKEKLIKFLGPKLTKKIVGILHKLKNNHEEN